MSKNEYLGIRTTKEVKEFLKNQAKILGKTTSELAHEILEGYCGRAATNTKKELF